jgi:D-glycero-D-manno-heptose 1,7-bisphosphate phosphatase
MAKALILDRDGVINEDTGYVHRIEDFSFIDGIFELCRYAMEKGYLIIIATNQGGISRGYYTEAEYQTLTTWMVEEFHKQGVIISAVYHSSYHSDGHISQYMQDEADRKPNPGMILKAQVDFNLDLSQSVLLGDKNSDIEAGRRAGIGKLIALNGRYRLDRQADVCVIQKLIDLTNMMLTI